MISIFIQNNIESPHMHVQGKHHWIEKKSFQSNLDLLYSLRHIPMRQPVLYLMWGSTLQLVKVWQECGLGMSSGVLVVTSVERNAIVSFSFLSVSSLHYFFTPLPPSTLPSSFHILPPPPPPSLLPGWFCYNPVRAWRWGWPSGHPPPAPSCSMPAWHTATALPSPGASTCSPFPPPDSPRPYPSKHWRLWKHFSLPRWKCCFSNQLCYMQYNM